MHTETLFDFCPVCGGSMLMHISAGKFVSFFCPDCDFEGGRYPLNVIFTAETYLKDFLSNYPNCQKLADGRTPRLCVESVYGIKSSFECRSGNCDKCWNMIIKK